MKTNERSWVHSLVPDLGKAMRGLEVPGVKVGVSDGHKLPYTCEIHDYAEAGAVEPRVSRYETDLLICDTGTDGHWIPRVVVECKLGSITTHDALTYSTKASTHKHVHPYLRYGVLLGARKKRALPGRLVKHGTYFDFMIAWEEMKPTKTEWKSFCALITEEVKASRTIQKLLTTTRSATRRKYHTVHRPLMLK